MRILQIIMLSVCCGLSASNALAAEQYRKYDGGNYTISLPNGWSTNRLQLDNGLSVESSYSDKVKIMILSDSETYDGMAKDGYKHMSNKYAQFINSEMFTHLTSLVCKSTPKMRQSNIKKIGHSKAIINVHKCDDLSISYAFVLDSNKAYTIVGMVDSRNVNKQEIIDKSINSFRSKTR